MKHTFTAFLLTLFVFGCSKTENKTEITNQTYFIQVFNPNSDNISLTIKTSLEKEKTVAIPKNSEKETEINFLAAAGEYVKFRVTNNGSCIYRVLDSKGVTIALYESLPSSTGNTVELDFIAFAPGDMKKDFMKYKTGLAKTMGDNLVGRPYLLHERYYLENGVKTDNSWVQESCSYNDEYQFLPVRGEFGNFNPERLVFSSVIDKDKSSCSYGPGQIMPSNISVVTNGSSTISFPIWDRLSIDGPPSSMIYRQLTIDSINSAGILTLHRDAGSKKEVFVYQPK
jgi:protease II